MILDSATVTSLTMMADRGGKRTNPLPLCNEEASVSALRMRGVNKSSGMGADSLIMYKPHFFFHVLTVYIIQGQTRAVTWYYLSLERINTGELK